MEKLRIIGGKRLAGSISCSGAKNAALPMLAATILTDAPVSLKNLPYLQDITTMFELLGSMGADITLNENMDFKISTDKLHDFEARYELVKTMRASILVLGPLVARYGFAKIALPGGCAIGTRPVDFHLSALEQLGAKIELKNGYIEASAKKLIGCEINFPGISVTGTENIMMAAVLAQGRTILRNVAKEPEVEDLADFLNSMGARVTGAGSDEIIIDGVKSLHEAAFTIPADRIEAGTYLVAAAITYGDITITNINSNRMNNILDKLKLSGAEITPYENSIRLEMAAHSITPVDISTAPFPGFPTDMQAQFTVLNALSSGSAVVTENVFENRFMHVQELNRMGCDITVKGSNAFVKGVSAITGAPVMATDLRASASLILAGLCAEGETIVDRIYHIDRGYERIEEKLSFLGADITRLPG
ncbi:UDP-N-acetylglucosamine 1-carboxyvinyltransferase [Gammaproteobacteria bacterium]|nr:UDP-N-acetylglucosamine 1-carboxyvinyltransferase [Gammaproteobacteria bacterium]MDB9700901.1 UDP-N-acetylglucosamine 1-carboxyvinyltransferase [Gammaproteobacteria bacterium]MDC1326104.1 UDP-N-acetylglucosamine 1-carboxyvinyltransferase [Gammaproteobacteria bacterium]